MNRAEYKAAHAATTHADVAFALAIANTPDEVDAAAHLSLIVTDVAGTLTPFTERGREYQPLHQLVALARHRVNGLHGTTNADMNYALDDYAERGRQIRRAELKAIRAARDARIERIGFTNATT